MARAMNIGSLALHCFRPSEDNLTVKYDKNKADQSGEKVHEKHLLQYMTTLLNHWSLSFWLLVCGFRLSRLVLNKLSSCSKMRTPVSLQHHHGTVLSCVFCLKPIYYRAIETVRSR
jgi:hypothetical protein